MKSKTLNALIVDADLDSSRQFLAVIKNLFHKTYHVTDPASALKEIQETKPQVIFINLNMDQRQKHLELIENLGATDGNKVIFGHGDSFDSEFLAHVIEIGANDIFARPFDGDIISSKINRFYQNELTQDRELNYSSISPNIKAKVEFTFQIVSVDENGITLKCPHHLNKGTVLPLTGGISQEIFETKSIDLMITRTWISDNWKDYFLYAEPKDSKEQHSSALRKFILSKI